MLTLVHVVMSPAYARSQIPTYKADSAVLLLTTDVDFFRQFQHMKYGVPAALRQDSLQKQKQASRVSLWSDAITMEVH